MFWVIQYVCGGGGVVSWFMKLVALFTVGMVTQFYRCCCGLNVESVVTLAIPSSIYARLER